MVSAPNPSTAAAGAKILASTWNADVRDADTYFNDVIGGIGPRNVLINSHMDVWQRGSSFAITSSATPQYHADRWCTRRNGATGATVSRQTGPTGQKYTMRVQRDSGNSNTTAIETMQPIESLNSLRLAGQTCQLKLTLKAGGNFSATSSLVTVKVTYGTGTDQAPPASGWTGTTDALSTTQAITTTATDYTFDSISIPTTATQVQVSVSFTPVGTASTNDWFELSAAQLTAGKASGWERLPAGDVLARCYRYFYMTEYTDFIGGTAQTTAQIGCYVKFPVPMRVAPTISSPAGTYNISHKWVGNKTSTNLPVVSGSSTNAACIEQSGFTTLTAFQQCEYTSGPHPSFTAEL